MPVVQLLVRFIRFQEKPVFPQEQSVLMEASILGVGWLLDNVRRQLCCPYRTAFGCRVSELAHLDDPREKERNNPIFFSNHGSLCSSRRKCHLEAHPKVASQMDTFKCHTPRFQLSSYQLLRQQSIPSFKATNTLTFSPCKMRKWWEAIRNRPKLSASM